MKEKLRKEFLLHRKTISIDRKKEAESVVLIKLKKMTQGYNHILSYSPLGDEVSVIAFNRFLQEEKRLSLPRIENQSIVPYAVRDMENQLKTFSHKFLEPDFSCEKSKMIDLVLVPGILFDKQGGRIGFGKGHYDKFLEKKKIKSIGVCFKEQVYNKNLPLEQHDISMESLCIV